MKTDLSRITIDVPTKLHQKFKAIAASRGLSMREMVISYMDRQTTSKDEPECSHSHTPNKRTKKSIKDSRNKKNLVECKDINDLIKKLGY